MVLMMTSLWIYKAWVCVCKTTWMHMFYDTLENMQLKKQDKLE